VSYSIALDETASASAVSAGWRPPTLRSALLGLLARYGAWMRRRDDAARLAEMDPRLARDIGAAPGGERRPEGFAADPRPLWGIGLTPQPMDGHAPWSAAAGHPQATTRSRSA
jgi:uncharacterized protein YjiS (DUF1127 family)